MVIDGGGIELFTVRSDPCLPQTREGEWRPAFHADQIRTLCRAIPLPFVETIGRDQTATPLHGVAEGRLFVDGITTRVDQQREGLPDPSPMTATSPSA